MCQRILLFGLIVFYGGLCFGDELLGRFYFESWLIRPSITIIDQPVGGFQAPEVIGKFRWERNEHFDSYFSLGSNSLLNTMKWFPSEEEEGGIYGVIEAYIRYRFFYGEVLAGLIPLRYGLEGAGSEVSQVFPRSLFLQDQVLAFRNFGASFFSHNPDSDIYTYVAAYNGEGRTELDNFIWYQGQWGYGLHGDYRVGFGGIVGYTAPVTTNPDGSRSDLSVLDVDRNAKVRIGNIFFERATGPWFFQSEVHVGKVFQTPDEKIFVGGHFDFSYDLGSQSELIFRYDEYDDNVDIKNTLVQEYSVGWSLFNKYKTSLLSVLLTQTDNQSLEKTTYKTHISWRFSPRVRN